MRIYVRRSMQSFVGDSRHVLAKNSPNDVTPMLAMSLRAATPTGRHRLRRPPDDLPAMGGVHLDGFCVTAKGPPE